MIFEEFNLVVLWLLVTTLIAAGRACIIIACNNYFKDSFLGGLFVLNMLANCVIRSSIN